MRPPRSSGRGPLAASRWGWPAAQLPPHPGCPVGAAIVPCTLRPACSWAATELQTPRIARTHTRVRARTAHACRSRCDTAPGAPQAHGHRASIWMCSAPRAAPAAPAGAVLRRRWRRRRDGHDAVTVPCCCFRHNAMAPGRLRFPNTSALLLRAHVLLPSVQTRRPAVWRSPLRASRPRPRPW